tara:strand:- start:969 stop:1304 length:336 start_codon:yes stop_codon:yes gene_type:complete
MDETSVKQLPKIPDFNVVKQQYNTKWEEEKLKFLEQIEKSFSEAVSAWRSGQIEVYQLKDGPYSKYYERAFRDFFPDTGYQATVGTAKVNPSGNIKYKPLLITLPDCFNNN